MRVMGISMKLKKITRSISTFHANSPFDYAPITPFHPSIIFPYFRRSTYHLEGFFLG